MRQSLRYFFSVGIILITLVLMLGLLQITGAGVPYVLFFGSVVLIALYLGKGPAVVGSVMAALIGGYFLNQHYQNTPFQAAFHSLVFFVISYIVIAQTNYTFKKKELKRENLSLTEMVRQSQEDTVFIGHQLNMAMETAGVGIWYLNLTTGESYWSDSFKHLLGYQDLQKVKPSREEWLKRLHPEDLAKLFLPNERIIFTTGSFSTEHRIFWDNGELHWVQFNSKLIYDDHGKPKMVIGTLINTDEKRREQQLLENLVIDKTSQLAVAQSALIQAAKMSALGEMAGGMAHEINSPLAFLRLKTEQILRKVKMGEEGTRPLIVGDLAKDLVKTMDTIDKISAIIKGLRSFAREGADELLNQIDVNNIVNNVLQLTRTKFKEQGIELREILCSTTATIVCREIQIEHAILNILSNAYDAVIEEKDKWVEIKVEQLDRMVKITVADSGKGVHPSIRHKIMQPFFTTKDVSKGTGLGLSEAKGIIEAHKGTLVLDENTEHTRFVITLPSG